MSPICDYNGICISSTLSAFSEGLCTKCTKLHSNPVCTMIVFFCLLCLVVKQSTYLQHWFMKQHSFIQKWTQFLSQSEYTTHRKFNYDVVNQMHIIKKCITKRICLYRLPRRSFFCFCLVIFLNSLISCFIFLNWKSIANTCDKKSTLEFRLLHLLSKHTKIKYGISSDMFVGET